MNKSGYKRTALAFRALAFALGNPALIDILNVSKKIQNF